MHLVCPQGAAYLYHTSLQLDVEESVEERVEGAVEECQSFDDRVDRLRDLVFILCPDVDQMDHKVGSPANDETGDDAEGHLDRLDLGAVQKPSILDGLPQCHSSSLREFLALMPDHTDNVDVTEGNDERRDDENV